MSAVVRNAAGQLLLVRTATAGWELPGGRVEEGETLHAALRREVREEAGAGLSEIGALSGAYHVVESGLVLLVFHATSACVTVAPANDDDDVLEARWFEPNDALRHVTHEREHQRLADALAAPPSPIVRSD